MAWLGRRAPPDPKALAAATSEGERQALHVAKAAPAPSELVAARLVERAEGEFARRGAVAAASVWSQAAGLTPPGPRRQRRLLSAGSALLAGGRAEEAAGCLREILSSGATVELAVRADALVLLSMISVWEADAVETAEAAIATADQLQDADPLRARRLLTGAIICLESRGLLGQAASLLHHPSWKAPAETALPAGFPEHHQVLIGDATSLRRMAGAGRVSSAPGVGTDIGGR